MTYVCEDWAFILSGECVKECPFLKKTIFAPPRGRIRELENLLEQGKTSLEFKGQTL
jgi:hypothetical protein